jgi:type IV pilus assembly protein PilC
MPQFRYRAARPNGTLVEARIDGDSEGTVRVQLAQQGLLLFSLDWTRSSTSPALSSFKSGRLSLREFLVFNQEFLALVRAGLPILKLFDLLIERCLHPTFRTALQGVRQEIRGGASLSEAMTHYPTQFSDLYRASLQSGEHTGNIAEVLQRYIAYLKLVISVREKVAKAMAYPVFLILVGLAVMAFLLMYVMPTFAEVYGQSQTQLPTPTRLLLILVENLQIWLPWLIVCTAGPAPLIYRWARSEDGRKTLDRLSLRAPFIGDVLLKSQIIRVARTLSTVLAGGIPLLLGLQITSGAITNRVIAEALSHTTDRVRQGNGLAASLKQEGFLPPMTLEMIAIGEATGALESMLQDVAEFHEGEMDLRLSQLTTWIEPMLLLVMGFLVGGIVIAMYLPVFQLAGTV